MERYWALGFLFVIGCHGSPDKMPAYDQAHPEKGADPSLIETPPVGPRAPSKKEPYHPSSPSTEPSVVIDTPQKGPGYLPYCEPTPPTFTGPVVMDTSLVQSLPHFNRYDSLLIRFPLQPGQDEASERVDQASFEANFYLKEEGGSFVGGSFLWTDGKSVRFVPYQPLKANQSYEWGLAGCQSEGALQAQTTTARTIIPQTFSFKTNQTIALTAELNGRLLTDHEAHFFAKAEHPSLELSYTTSDPKALSSIHLRKVGVDGSIALCPDPRIGCEKTGVIPLSELGPRAPNEGMNSYALTLIKRGESPVTKLIEFMWGEVDENPQDLFENGAALLIPSNALTPLSEVMSQFASGGFRMDFKDEEGEVFENQSFNDLIQRNQSSERPIEVLDAKDQWQTCQAGGGHEFSYLTHMGPFCGIRVRGDKVFLKLAKLDYEVVSDIYITSFEVSEKKDHVTTQLSLRDDQIELKMGAKEVRGVLTVVIHIEKVHLYKDLEKILGDLTNVKWLSGKRYVYEVPFFLDEKDFQWAQAYTDLSFDENHRAKIDIRGHDEFDLYQSVHGDAQTDRYFHIKDWVDQLQTGAPKLVSKEAPPIPVLEDIVEAMVGGVLKSEIPRLKPVILNGALSDIMEKIAPKILSSVFDQFRQGIEVPLPSYLPASLSELKLALLADVKSNLQVDAQKGLRGQVDVAMGVRQPEHKPAPKRPKGTLGFIRLAPKELEAKAPSLPLDSQAIGLSLHPDVLNQALFNLFAHGGLELKLTKKDYLKVTEVVAIEESLNQKAKAMFNPDFIPDLLNRDIEGLKAFPEEDEKPLLLQKDDQMTMAISARLPPTIRLLEQPLEEGESSFESPLWELKIGHLLIDLVGQQGERQYVLSRLRVALRLKARIYFGGYDGPSLDYKGQPGLKIKVLTDPSELDYEVEVIEKQALNPFGLDAPKIARIVRDVVDDTLIPVINDLFKDVPLPDFDLCGLSVDLRSAEIGRMGTDYGDLLALKAPLKAVPFEGRCKLTHKKPESKLRFEDPPPLPRYLAPPVHTVELSPGGSCQNKSIPTLPSSPSDCRPRPEPPKQVVISDGNWDVDAEDRFVPRVHPKCPIEQILQTPSCSVSEVLRENGEYRDTLVYLYSAIPKKDFALLESDGTPSLEGRYMDFDHWKDYINAGDKTQDVVVINQSTALPDETDPDTGRTYLRQYSDYKMKVASFYVNIRVVTRYRILDQPFGGAEFSVVYGIDSRDNLDVPEGAAPLNGAEQLEYHYGEVHILDCGKQSWCGSDDYWIILYKAFIRPEDQSIPEEVAPDIETSLNALIRGMFK